MTVTEHLTSEVVVNLIEPATLAAGPLLVGEWTAVAPNPDRPEGYWTMPMPMLELFARWCDEHGVGSGGVAEMHREVARVCDQIAPALANDRCYTESADGERPRFEATGRARFRCPDGTVWSAFITLIDHLDDEGDDDA